MVRACMITVEDDGPGFPDFLLAQGNSAQCGISFETGSTGLGLYFAGVVARLHKTGNDDNPHCGSIHLNNGGRSRRRLFQSGVALRHLRALSRRPISRAAIS
jgi:hypothetical protein